MSQLIIDLMGHHLDPHEATLLSHPQCAGVILFARNYHDTMQLKTLTQHIRMAGHPDLLVMVDQEGGQVQRFKEGFEAIPAMHTLGQQHDRNPELACAQAKSWAQTSAAALQAVGIDFSIGPVLDLHDAKASIIGQKQRAFHQDPSVVMALAASWIEGLHEAGMAAVGKHFPGHGRIPSDSHTHRISDTRSFEALEADLKPFEALHPTLQGIMPAHLHFPNICPDVVTQSAFWLHNVLRTRMGFEGACISDCITMVGSGDVPILEKIQRTLIGCDAVIWSHCEGYNQPLWPAHKRTQHLVSIMDQLPTCPPATRQRLSKLQACTSHLYQSLH